jgi:hypothetical protein
MYFRYFDPIVFDELLMSFFQNFKFQHSAILNQNSQLFLTKNHQKSTLCEKS